MLHCKFDFPQDSFETHTHTHSDIYETLNIVSANRGQCLSRLAKSKHADIDKRLFKTKQQNREEM